MATAVKQDLTKKTGYKLQKITKNGVTKYTVLQYTSVFNFLKVFKIWNYVKDDNKRIRFFKDLRSAQAYINYQTNPEMKKG